MPKGQNNPTLPQYSSYTTETSIVTADKILFSDTSANALKTITFANLVLSVRSAIASYFTLASVIPSDAPSAGQLLVGNAGSTAFARKTISGDVTVASTGAMTIANDAVTFSKQEDLAASRLVGRGSASGTGDPQPITLGPNLSMSGTTLNVTAGTGNVVQASSASEANHVFVSGGADKSRVETPVEIDPSTGDVSGIEDLVANQVIVPTIAIDTAHDTDNTFHGITIKSINAGATIPQWSLVHLDASGEWQLTDAGSPYTGAFPARGVATEDGTSGDPLVVGLLGSARNDAWTLTPGNDLFMSTTAGGFDQLPPVTPGDEKQKVGFAVSATKALFSFGAMETSTV